LILTSIEHDILARILNNLRFKSKGMTITELSRKTGINRNSVAKYLQILLVSGQVDVQTVGNAKVYTFSHRLPISSMLSAFSSLIAVINDEGTILEINDSFVQFFGLEREKCLAATLENADIPIISDPKIATSIMDEIDGDGSVHNISIMHDENSHHFQVKLIPSVLEGGCKGIVVLIEDITEKISSDEALQESEALFSLTIDSVSDTLYVIDSGFRIEQFNIQFEKLCRELDLDIEDAAGRDIFEVFKLIPELFRDYYMKILQSKEPFVSEEILLWNGNKFITEINMVPVVENKEVRHIITTIHDLTYERESEDAFSGNEEALRKFFENSNDGLFLVSVNANGKPDNFLMVNDSLCEMLHYTHDELLPLPLYMIACSEDEEKFINGISLGISRDLIIHKCEFRRKDGSTFPVEVFSHPYYYDNLLTSLSVVRNPSNKRLNDHFSDGSADEIMMAVQSTNLGIWNYNPETDSLKMEGCFGRITGYSPEEIPDSFDAWTMLVHPSDLSSLRHALYEHLGGRSDIFRQDIRIRHKDGYWIWGNMLGRVTMCNDQGHPCCMTGIFRDISETRLYDKALREANKKLNVLSGVIRHDVLNQITGVRVYLDLLEEQLPEDPDAHEYLRQIKIITEKIQRQVAFSRAFQDLGVRPPGWQHIETIVQRAKRDVSLGSLKENVSTGSLEIFADPLLVKVFGIFFSNVIQHAAGATEVNISFSEVGDHGVLVFRDNGSGIPDNLKTCLFDWGFGKDSGNGLFIAREILGITCLSIMETGREGEGARFEIFLPPKSFRQGL